MVQREGRITGGFRDTDIVVGVDGSPSSKAALRWALAQARRTGARVQAVTSWEYPAYYGMGAVVPYEDFAATAGKILSESVQEALGVDEPDVPVLETVVAGHAAQVLIDKSAHAGLLVVGSRGHGAFTGTLLGSVSQHCAQHAHCPVVVVRGKG
ncbi:universal stress protein UspA [Actinoplanes sp. ATCC 53533]|uniref:universal stress protein n=1 Tax=Actinoplanes sp. ATCC 53533 TaxID=1288362 RepID=UPI000F7AEEE1|nr:universal stress protein [Actinoplanes sp. ATCC 53533]RSM49367.1 universal stress protein UspA [Actinoplanes sp. ATCC 53533]